MITVRGFQMFYRQPWMQEDEAYTAQMKHDDADESLSFQLPNGSVVQLSYLDMRSLISDIEKRRLAD